MLKGRERFSAFCYICNPKQRKMNIRKRTRNIIEICLKKYVFRIHNSCDFLLLLFFWSPACSKTKKRSPESGGIRGKWLFCNYSLSVKVI